LFSEAVDPLGALRWNLAALRRLLHRPDALKGDAISLAEADIAVDTVQLESGEVDEPLQGPCGRELLAGLSFPDSPMFELWLAGERQRLRRRSVSLTREHSLDALARGDHDLAIRLAKELVAAEPFDEGHHALLIRTLALSGEHDAARHQYDSCATLLRRELGIEPGPAVLAALHLVNNPVDGATEATFDEICARITVAWQSFLAGSIDHGLDMGRSTILLSDMSGDPDLAAASRLYFAGMLNMAVRGWDEAATATSEARHLASETGRVDHLALAHSITAGSELMRGDYAVALEHATAGVALDDQGALALNLAFLSAVESDTGCVEMARQHAIEASDAAERSLDGVGAAYAYSYSAHIDLDAGRYDRARVHAVKAIDASSSILVLQPWPTAMLAEIEVHESRSRTAGAQRARGAATGR
jgi:tetratricopeptide (TPR) repeat protein